MLKRKVCLPVFSCPLSAWRPNGFLPFLNIGRVSAPSKHFGACERHHLFLTGIAVAMCAHVTGRIVYSPLFRPSGSVKPCGGTFHDAALESHQIKPRTTLWCPSMPLTILTLCSPGCTEAIRGCTLRYGSYQTMVQNPSHMPMVTGTLHGRNCILSPCRTRPIMFDVFCHDPPGYGIGLLLGAAK